MRPNTVVLVNPAAGGRPERRLRAELTRTVTPDALRETTSREDVILRTRAALQGGADMVVAVGGDGTVNGVAQGFFGGDQPSPPVAMLGVIPCGTGSDYARSLGLARDWQERLARPRPVTVDVGQIAAGGTTEVFLNMLSFGVAAEAVAGKGRAPSWHPKTLKYLLPTVAAAVSGKAQTVSLRLDGRTVERRLLAVLVAKGHYAGGGMRVGTAALDDGGFTVTMVGDLAPLTVLCNLHRIYNGALGLVPGIEQVRASQITLACPSPWTYEIDGEVRAPTARAEVANLRRSLTVAV